VIGLNVQIAGLVAAIGDAIEIETPEGPLHAEVVALDAGPDEVAQVRGTFAAMIEMGEIPPDHPVTAVQGDAASLDDLDRLFDTVKREKGAVDVLWASAGTGEQGGLGEITEEHFDAAFGLNARGTLFTVQKALPLFNDGGSIFMTGSNASQRGYPGWSVYAASKAVQQAYARVWLAELKDKRIRVNVLTPGQVATAKQEEVFDEETRRQFESLIPRGTMGRAEEIATIALFLASDDSSYVNGMELVADGGTTTI